MNTEQKEKLRRLHTDFPFYASNCLKIRVKKAVEIDGQVQKIIPFILNKAQSYIHKKLETQKKEKGYVRALLLKGRQQGCSTYVEGRFFHKTTQAFGIKTFILTHEDKATANIFRMAKRYYEHCPEMMRPNITLLNAKELYFNKLDSAYGVGTAGTGDVGRSDTIDFLHGSECAFWNNTSSIKTGVLQAAEMAEEIILESTANGIGNMFHQMWQDAESEKGKYVAIFVPWYWQDEYREFVPDGFSLTPEEEKYMRTYRENGLIDIEQMVWRRNKLVELGDSLLFKQEYPGTSAEAFQTTGFNPFISAGSVMLSRKAKNIEKYGPYIIGCDPAREGDDLTVFVRRQGRVVFRIETHAKLDDMQKTGVAKLILDREPVTRMFIDRGGGSGMYDRLKEMGYGKRISLVNFGGKAMDNDKYKNRRSEMWGEMKNWLESDEETQIPDDDSLHADMVSCGITYTSTTQIQLEKKEDIKKRLGRSPDKGDAVALTFAEPVAILIAKPIRPGYQPLDCVIGY